MARSPELNTFAVLAAAGGAMIVLGSPMVASLESMLRRGLTVDRAAAFDTSLLGARLYEGALAALVGISPLLLVVALAAIAAPLLLSGWLFTFRALEPDFSRLNPRNGFARMLSWAGLIELGKSILKTALIGGVAAWAIWAERAEIVSLSREALASGLPHLGALLGFTFLAVVGGLALVVAVDVPFQLWDHARHLRMTKEEVRQELKETEGDPQIKARIRSLQREAARRRMMAEVPKADVVVTNPLHFAVALRYSGTSMRAPRVVAKGMGLIAERIREIALEHHVPILRQPPLARALHAHADLGREIPAALYGAVAEVLAYVYQLRRFESEGGQQPAELHDVAVPAELDPEVRTG